MKTTKEIAELFCDELDRLAKGEVRIGVITGLDKCANALVKLARLEMDYAWRDWSERGPAVPWVASSLVEKPKQLPEPIAKPKSVMSGRIADLEREIEAAKSELANPNTRDTMRIILEDKVQKWEDKIAFLNANKSKV
jgi:hypothetical protein